ncbi:DUF192 domain-containing protein [Marinobacterium sp. D7]|nr:DUF192 domain-containing protein [Marinobacterium ramblicola]
MLLLAWSAPLLACSSQSAVVRTLQVGPANFRTEIVAGPEARQRGLMGRTELSDEMAMLFVFPDEQRRAFWMKDTPLALSIAYIDRRGIIQQISSMEPYSLERVTSLEPAMYGLEVKQGVFERRGVRVGHRLDLDALHGITAEH